MADDSEKMRAWRLAYYYRNKDVINAKRRENRLNNLDARRKRDREYRAKRLDYFHEANRKFRIKTKHRVINHYGGRCSCCGEEHIEFLTIDHIDGGGSSHRRELKKSGQVFYDWLIKQNFPVGFRVLCFNCNCSRGAFGYCPHEKEREESKSA